MNGQQGILRQTRLVAAGPAALPQLASGPAVARHRFIVQRCNNEIQYIGKAAAFGICKPAGPLPISQQHARRVVCRNADNNAASISAIPVSAVITSSPLQNALEHAQAMLAEKTRIKAALEAEAQEVAQLAVRAAEAKDRAKKDVADLMAVIDEATKRQQQGADKIAQLGERIQGLASSIATLPAGDDQAKASSDAKCALEAELAAAESQAAGVSQQLAELKVQLEELTAKAAAAESSAAKAEAVASAAMKAVEAAVKEEVLAAAVVKETQQALGKTLTNLATLSVEEDSLPAGAAAAAAVGAAVDAVGGAAAAPAAAAAAAGAAAAADGTVPAASDPSGDSPKSSPNYAVYAVAAVAVAAAVGGWWALHNTAPGQAVMAGLGKLMHAVAHKIGHIHVHEGEKGVVEAIYLLFSSIICVPLVVKMLPGGSPVLGYLLGGAIVGPYALGLIQDVQSVKHLAELGVVFLLFNIGLELSLDRLRSMAKFVFGMGSAQVVLTLLGVGLVAHTMGALSGPASIILGGALAMSSTAVAIQVLEDRGEMGSRHGRATFSVLLLQDLAVVVLLMLIPLLAPSPDGASGGIMKILKALGAAAVKAVVCIVGIIAGGRLFIKPLYKKMSSFANAEIFAATTLLVVLGTSILTSIAGLSLALGAFLAGLLIAETEYALQVESDIHPYKGLLLGLFFMSVGMEISGKLFLEKWKEVIASIVALIVGKVAVMAVAGPLFGLSRIAAIRAGLLLAPGGEFAFVALGESVTRGIMTAALANQLYLVVALSMALTPYLAAFGAKVGAMMEKNDMKDLQPQEQEMKELHNHVIICGYGRAGQLVGQLLSENMIPFAALDVSNERVAAGKAKDMPVYFGDAGSPAVLHLVGAERAACAVIALDTPGANYRAVWAMNKHFPHVKTYVRAHDLSHALNLEKAGATAVVPEILEPSLQLAASVLTQLEWKADEVTNLVDDFRRKHLQELQAMTSKKGTTLGYGFSTQQRQQDAKQLPAAAAASSGEAAAADAAAAPAAAVAAA